METRRIGRCGLEVSEIGLGSWLTLGSGLDTDGGRGLVQRAFDLGINLFDTADVYGNGAAEEALGRAVAELPRRHLVLATKCYFAMSEKPNDSGLSRKHICESVEGSLRRLRSDYLDLHQCHRADPRVPLEETVRAYEDLVRQGKILYWGVSHWTGKQIEEACRIADDVRGYRPIASQPEYSILRRDIEAELMPVCARAGLGQLVFSPLGQGALTGKYLDGARPSGSRATDPRRNRWMGDYLDDAQLARVAALRPLAREVGISLAQLAIAWCLRSPAVASVIVGATRIEQLEENCAASGIVLPDEILRRIDAIAPPPTRPAG